jgi:iron complex outermembrane recepter protein
VHVRTSTVVGMLTGSGFVLARRLENPLPFAYIDLDRRAGGTRLALDREDGPLRWSVGVEAALQRDDRQNWANDQGNRGAPLLGQVEGVSSTAAFGHAYLNHGRLILSAGARVDRTRFEAEDRLQAAGDQSGRRVLGAFSPTAGLSYRTGSALVFVSASSAFETPTTTELVNRPGGAGGFNPDLQPQRTRGIEAGIRGSDGAGRLFYDVAVFQLNIRDQLAAFEGEGGRTFFRNVEATTHHGLEVYGEWHAAPGLRLSTTYAWSRFVFDEPSGQIAGNRLPGVPEHRITGRVHMTHRDVFGYVSSLVAGPTFADDANSARADGFIVVDLRLGHAGVRVPHGRLLPFVQIRNLFDAHYAGSVAINARAGRYFEPAAGRSFQLGLSLALDS